MATRDKKEKSELTEQEAKVSRRNFIKGTAIAGAGAAAILQAEKSQAQEGSELNIKIPEEIPRTLAEAAKPANFPMTGAEVFAKFCKDEGVAGFFCCPGNYNMINAIAAEGIPSYGGRCEGNMVSAADGFIRVTGEIAATSGTEGPGFTNMIMNIGAANSSRTPLLVIASNKTIGEDGNNNPVTVNRDIEMGKIFSEFLSEIEPYYDLINLYSLTSNYAINNVFGLKEYTGQKNSVKYSAVIDWIEN